MSSTNGIGPKNPNQFLKSTSLPIRRTQSSISGMELSASRNRSAIAALAGNGTQSIYSDRNSDLDQYRSVASEMGEIKAKLLSGDTASASAQLADLSQRLKPKSKFKIASEKIQARMGAILQKASAGTAKGTEKLKGMGQKAKVGVKEWGGKVKENIKTTSEKVKTTLQGGATAIADRSRLATAQINRRLLPGVLKQGGTVAMFTGADPLLLAPKWLKQDSEVLEASKNYSGACARAASATKSSATARTKFLGVKLATGLGISAALSASVAGLGALIVALANRDAAGEVQASSDQADLPDCDMTNTADFSELAESDPEMAASLDQIFDQINDPEREGANDGRELRAEAIEEFKEVFNSIPAEDRQEFLENFSSSALSELMDASHVNLNLEGSGSEVYLQPEAAHEVIDTVLEKTNSALMERSEVSPESQGGDDAVGMGAAYGAIFGASIGGAATIALMALGEQKIRKSKNSPLDPENQGFQNQLLATARTAHQDAKAARAEARNYFDTELSPVIESKLEGRVSQAQMRVDKKEVASQKEEEKGTFSQTASTFGSDLGSVGTGYHSLDEGSTSVASERTPAEQFVSSRTKRSRAGDESDAPIGS